MKDKLKSAYNWDGSSTVAAVAANLDKDGEISNWELHIFGKSSTFYTKQDEGNYLRFKEIEMSNFTFKNSLASEWLSPANCNWEYRLPHETERQKFYGVKEIDLSQYNAKPLWVRSLCQVTTDFPGLCSCRECGRPVRVCPGSISFDPFGEVLRFSLAF